MNYNDLFAQPDVIEALATIAAGALLIAVTAAVTLATAHFGVKKIRDIWLVGRGKLEAMIELVDELDDPALVKLDGLLDKVLAADWNKHAAAFMPVFLRALADGIDNALGIPDEPEQGDPGGAVNAG